MNQHYLQFDNISKAFPGVRALDQVSFGVGQSRVHALLGENGAGKSTLLKILAGVHRPDTGAICLGGTRHTFHRTADAIAAGVAVIQQELQLVPHLSVAENLFLGHLPTRFGWLDRRQLANDARQLLTDLGEDIDPAAMVGDLPIAQRQMVEIAKALSRSATVIAFDEPTSSLSGPEVQRLFTVIRQLKDNGRVILYVSHRMEEVLEICDAATVLRDGQHIRTFASLDGIGHDDLLQPMVGRSITDIFHYTPRPIGQPMLEVRGMMGPGLRQPASFHVAAGEIISIFGLVGAGRTELLKLLFGATRPTAGAVSIAGQTVNISTPAAAIAAGMVLCPEDRKKEGIITTASVMDNLNLSTRDRFSSFGFVINPQLERQNADRYISQLGIKTPSPHQAIVNLSGGNQQKVILGRWLGGDIRVLLLDEPTRGIDVGAKSEIYSIIYELAGRGVAVLVVSSELPEALGISDRVLVMRQGELVADLPRQQATPEQVMRLALPASAGAIAGQTMTGQGVRSSQ